LSDIDHPISTVTWFFIGISIIGMIVGWYLKNDLLLAAFFGLLVFTYFCAHFVPHRGPIHSIPAGILFSIPIYFIFGLPEALLGFICFYSHLCSDGEWFKFF